MGNPPEVDHPDEEIPNVFEDVEIRDDPLDKSEYLKVKASLKLGKAAGPMRSRQKFSNPVILMMYAWIFAMKPS